MAVATPGKMNNNNTSTRPVIVKHYIIMLLYRSGTGRHRWSERERVLWGWRKNGLETHKKSDLPARKVGCCGRRRLSPRRRWRENCSNDKPPPLPRPAAQPKRPPLPPVLQYNDSTTTRRRRLRARLLVPRPPASTRQRPRSFGLVCQSPPSAGPAAAATTQTARTRHRARPFPVGPTAVSSL